MNDVKVHVVDSAGIESEAQRIRQAFRDRYPEIAAEWVDADFTEIEERLAARQGMKTLEEMKRMAIPIGLGEMLAEQMAEQRERMRWGNTPKTKPPGRFTWKDKDPGRAKAKAARKQNKKRRQK